jgi:hypothetical protein
LNRSGFWVSHKIDSIAEVFDHYSIILSEAQALPSLQAVRSESRKPGCKPCGLKAEPEADIPLFQVSGIKPVPLITA